MLMEWLGISPVNRPGQKGEYPDSYKIHSRDQAKKRPGWVKACFSKNDPEWNDDSKKPEHCNFGEAEFHW